MLYTDAIFLWSFGLLCLLTRLLRPWPVFKEWFLIGVSFLVIASWGLFDLELFLAVLLVNYLGATGMVRARPWLATTLLATLIVLDLALLLVFKYANFIGHNFGAITGSIVPTFPLGIPLAISFYVFHLISYLVDLHAKRIKLATIREYVFYLTFFPHVIAGPIVRAWQLVPQIGKTRRVRGDLFMGFHFLVTGFFLKMVMANNIGAVIDPFWTDDTALSTLDHWIVAFLYYCQIYGDFAGYSLMALGMARLLGYRLPVNFRSPMRAATVQEFWQRWHITLSKWLRDYLYIPLGGNRVSRLCSARNVMLTMLLGGLWHGAGWCFLLWGAMQGMAIVMERVLGLKSGHSHRWVFLSWIIVQLWITVAWVFFRAPSIHFATGFLWHMLPVHGLDHFLAHSMELHGLLFALPVIAHNFVPLLFRAVGRRRLGIVLGVSTGIMLLANFMVYSPHAVFIYFKF